MKKNSIGLILSVILISTISALADGKGTYEASCQKCHGADAAGKTKMGEKLGVKDYSVAKNWEVAKDPAKAVKEGVKEGDKTLMKPFGETLSDAEIKDVVAYMKGLAK